MEDITKLYLNLYFDKITQHYDTSVNFYTLEEAEYEQVREQNDPRFKFIKLVIIEL